MSYGFEVKDEFGDVQLSTASYGWMLKDTFDITGGESGSTSYSELLGYELSTNEVNTYSGSGYHQYIWHTRSISYVDSVGGTHGTSANDRYPVVTYSPDISKTESNGSADGLLSTIYVFAR
jgi:hypothetical protein